MGSALVVAFSVFYTSGRFRSFIALLLVVFFQKTRARLVGGLGCFYYRYGSVLDSLLLDCCGIIGGEVVGWRKEPRYPQLSAKHGS